MAKVTLFAEKCHFLLKSDTFDTKSVTFRGFEDFALKREIPSRFKRGFRRAAAKSLKNHCFYVFLPLLARRAL